MKAFPRFSRLFALAALLAVALVGAYATVSSAADTILGFKPLQWKEVGAIVYTDTTFMTDESDTTRTSVVTTDDWDWDALLHNSLTGGSAAARVWFVSSTATNNGATDTLYYNVELGTGRDSVFAYSGTIAAAVGNCAISAGGITGAGPKSNVWSGPLILDPDAYTSQNLWLAPAFRLRVAGDQSGTTPHISGLKVYITYPQRAASK